MQTARTDNPAFSAVQDNAHGAEDDADDEEEDHTAAPPPPKKAKVVNPLKEWDARTMPQAERDRMTFFGYDVELSESNREHFAFCEIGVHVLKPAADGKSAAVSEDAADHFNERCLDEGCGWSEHSTKVHGISKESLLAEGARDHLVVTKAAFAFMEARVQADHPAGDGIGVLITHGGSACDLDTAWHYERRHGLKLPSCIK